LLERFARQHDDAAFAALVQRHGPMVLRVCRGVLRDPHRAEDAFQATFLTLVRKATAVRKSTSLGSWLYKVAYRIALAARAGAALRQSREHLVAGKEASDPLAEITGRELVTALDEELAGMAERYRAPLLLCVLEGMAQDEAAKQLGWSLSTLKRRLERGREVLRARLAGRGLALSAALGAFFVMQGSAGAAVPVSLSAAANQTIRAFSGGGSATVPASVCVLSEGAMLSFSVARLSLSLALLVGALVGVGGLYLQSASPRPPQAQQAPASPPTHAPAPRPDVHKALTTERHDPPPSLLPEKKKPILI